MKTALIIGVILLTLGTWFFISKTSAPDSEVIAQRGLHWHAELNIKIFGEIQDIPANIGLNPFERPIHTHEPDSIIHMEFSGLVKKDDVKLGEFFKIWGKTFNQNCIFNQCTGESGRLKMLVNGVENPEFENYSMHDGDKIEIIFE